MRAHEWIGGLLVASSILLLGVHYFKLRRERLRPTIRHSLFTSHLTSVLHRSR
jgi:hypothetical protein